MFSWPLRIIMFFVTTLCFLYGAYVVGLIFVILLSLQYRAYEFIALAFCIDCYFSPEPIMFWYTTVITIMVFFGIFLQPFIRRNGRYE
ncbi:MAG: hypothetical protein ACK4SL_01040 [Candidatus Paceibacteria bacterium]